MSRHSTIYKNIEWCLGGCCGFLPSKAVSIAMIVVGTVQFLSLCKKLSWFLFLKVGYQYYSNIYDDKYKCTATGWGKPSKKIKTNKLKNFNSGLIFFWNYSFPPCKNFRNCWNSGDNIWKWLSMGLRSLPEKTKPELILLYNNLADRCYKGDLARRLRDQRCHRTRTKSSPWQKERGRKPSKGTWIQDETWRNDRPR